MKKPILIGITGGTGSGKSTIADALYSNFSNCIFSFGNSGKNSSPIQSQY